MIRQRLGSLVVALSAGFMLSTDAVADYCCLVSTGPSCEESITNEAACSTAGGDWNDEIGVMCFDGACNGACCFVDDGQECTDDGTRGDCEAHSNGVFIGLGTACDGSCFGNCCFDYQSCQQDVHAGTCVEIGGHFIGDTFCHECFERAHPGWNHVSTEIMLTRNEPAYWSAYSGQPKGVAPFTVLDSGLPAGRPDPEHPGERVLRGYVVAWAVNANNQEIRWNHLKGDALIINYEQPSAWEYNAWAFQVVADVANGSQTGIDPGTLNMDGNEYAPGFDLLTIDFYASGSNAFSRNEHSIVIATDITLHPISIDLRQEDNGPVTTKAKVDVWNENEVKFNGTERCITCWDQVLLTNFTGFGVPNNFLYGTLQTDRGKARINGIRSDNCDVDYEFDPDVPFGDDPRDIVSSDASMVGLAAKHLSFGRFVNVASTQLSHKVEKAGVNLIGSGTESGSIQYDALGETPEAVGGTTAPRRGRNARSLGQILSDSGIGPVLTLGQEGIGSGGIDRLSGSEKGSLLMFSKVEIRWSASGELIQDTFIDITNDFGEDVQVQMYFINGDPPLVVSQGN